jgi:hypothetical protein
MADFATYALAEARVQAKVIDGTWIMGHSARQSTGDKICVRVIRKMTPTLMASSPLPTLGGWVEIVDNGAS